MKEKYLWAGIALVVISWIGNFIYFKAHQIETPIFLKHFYEQEFQSEDRLTLYYITNLNDTREVRYATIGDVEIYPESAFNHFMWTDGRPQFSFHQQFTYQGLRQVHFSIMEDSVEEAKDSDGNWSFSEMTVYFSDGSSTTQHIGVVVFRERTMNPVEEVVQSTFSSGSSDGSSRDGYKLLKDARITEVVVPFASELPEGMSIKIEASNEELQWQEDIFPIELKQGDRIDVSIKINELNHKALRFPIKIIGESTDGIPFTCRAYISPVPYLTKDEIKEVLTSFEGGVQ